MDKQALKQRMLSLEEAELEHALEHYRDHIAEARIDHSEPTELGATASAEAFGELAAAFDNPVHGHAEKLGKLKAIDFAPNDVVGEGAVIRLSGRWFVIAVSTTRFSFAGETLMGISTSAPIYEVLDGKKQGDVVTFNGREMTVEMVL